MARDANLVKRNLLALPGSVLTFYSLLGLGYVLGYREAGLCGDPRGFLIGGLCYNAVPFLAGTLLLGLVLLGLGLGIYRGRIEFAIDHLQAGTPTHMTVTLLGSLAIVLGLSGAVLYYLESSQGLTFGTQVGPFSFSTPFLFEIGAGIAVLALAPVLAMLGAQGRRRRRFLAAAEQEAEEHAEADAATPGTGLVPPEEFVEESSWPAAREPELVQNR